MRAESSCRAYLGDSPGRAERRRTASPSFSSGGCPMAWLWLTYLLSAVLASPTRPQATSTTPWTVIVGGATADTSIYANAFFPQTIEVGVGDTVTWTFEGFHNVAFLSGGAAPSFGVPAGDKTYWNPQVLFPAGGPSYQGTGHYNPRVARPGG